MWFWILLFWLALGTFLSWKFLCCDGSCKSSGAAINNNHSGKLALGNWTIHDENNFQVSSRDQLGFRKNEAKYLTPLSASLDTALNSTANYLKGNASRRLNVTGYYRHDEKNNDSKYANLGLARAGSIKDYLVSLGVPASQISTSGNLLDADWFTGDTLVKGAYFNFSESNTVPIDNNAPVSGDAVRSMAIYFNTNQSTKSLNSIEVKKINDLVAYLNKSPNAKLSVFGHTDNRGSRELNIALSNSRASFAKDYLINTAKIASDRLDVKGFSFDQPADTNDTRDGRARNRRVEISIK
jgi:outer membrane protein OmpA-like peptidoglycan-associated protein